MTTHFDPEQGVLRLRHGALAVLALLATDPTSTRLHDHDVAPRLAELRTAGLVGSHGVHPDVAPLAIAIGQAQTTAELYARDHDRPRLARCWISGVLTVIGVAVEDDPHTYELMADVPQRTADLLAEFLGLGAAPTPPVDGTAVLSEQAFDALLGADADVGADDVAAALAASGDPGPAGFSDALADGFRGAALRWRLIARHVGGDEPVLDIDVLDAGAAGLWLARRQREVVRVGPVRPDEVRADLAGLAA